MLSDSDAQVMALRQQLTIIDTRLMAQRQAAATAHRRIKICIGQLEYAIDDLPLTGDLAKLGEDIREVILSLKHINDFILGEPDHG
jgi:hypothetical protein